MFKVNGDFGSNQANNNESVRVVEEGRTEKGIAFFQYMNRLDSSLILEDCKNINALTLSPEAKKVKNKIDNLAAERGFSKTTRLQLYLSLPKSHESISRIIDCIHEKDQEFDAIYIFLLVNWKHRFAPHFSDLAQFFSIQTPEANQSYLSYLRTDGALDAISKNELKLELALHHISTKDPDDFKRNALKYKESLLNADKLGLFNEFVQAFNEAFLPDDAAQLIDCIQVLVSRNYINESNLIDVRFFFSWLADHTARWNLLNTNAFDQRIAAISLYRVCVEKCSLDLPQLDVFIQGMDKDHVKAMEIINHFSILKISPKHVYEDWVNASDDASALVHCFLNLTEAFTKKHSETISQFLDILEKANISIPAVEMTSLMTVGKITYLKTLCQWIKQGEENLAIRALLAYTSKNQVIEKIGRLALKQKIEYAPMYLLPALNKSENYPLYFPTDTNKTLRKPDHQKISKIFTSVCGEEGVEAIEELLHRDLAADLDDQKKTIGELFLDASPRMQKKIIDLCYAAESREDRGRLFRIIATYPSRKFIRFLLDVRQPSSIARLLRLIPDPSNLSRVIEVATGMIEKKEIPETSIGSFKVLNSQETVKELMSIPILRPIVARVFADSKKSQLANRVLVAMADWSRYGHSLSLFTFFQHYPLERFTNMTGEIVQEKLRVWEDAAIRLECGRFGYIEEVLAAIALNPSSLKARAIEACKAFENPHLLHQLLFCNERDPEAKSILQNLIDDPGSSWNRFHLQIKANDPKGSFRPLIDVTPRSRKWAQGLLDTKRPHLATKLLKDKSLVSAAKHLGICENIPPNIDQDKIMIVWNDTDQLAKAGKLGIRNSLPGYARFGEHDEYVQQYKEVMLSIAMAKAIVFDGTVPEIRVKNALKVIPKALSKSDHYYHLKNILRFLVQDEDLRHRIGALDNGFKLSPVGISIINGLFSRSKDHPVTHDDIRIALLSAILCRFRQDPVVGSCFMTSTLIQNSHSNSGIKYILDVYMQILGEGKVSAFNPVDKENEYIPVVPRLLELDLGLPIAHPLVKAFENTWAIKGNLKHYSKVAKARKAIFGPNGYCQALYKQIYNNYKRNRSEEISFDQYAFFEEASREFDKATLEIFNPRISSDGSSFSGWELVSSESLESISSVEAYKQLYAEVIKKTLAAKISLSVDDSSACSFLHEIEKKMLPFFSPNERSSDFFIDFLQKELSLKTVSDLWIRDEGGHSCNILASSLRKETCPSFEFTPNSCEQLIHQLLEYCAELPENVKSFAASQKSFYLPLVMPEHSLNLLPNTLIDLLAIYGKPQSALKAIQEDCLTFAQQTLNSTEAVNLANTVWADIEYTEKESRSLRKALKRYDFEGITYQALADIMLKEISLAKEGKQIPLKEISNLLDKMFWKNLEAADAKPFYVFADSNWIAEGHNNVLLAFGWSFVERQFKIFRTDRGLKNVRVLRMNDFGKGRWELFQPPFIQS